MAVSFFGIGCSPLKNATSKTCVQHCKDMLQKKVADASQEVSAARAEFAELKDKAERKASEAREHYNSLPVPGSASPSRIA